MVLTHSEINCVDLDGRTTIKKLSISAMFFDNSSSKLGIIRNWLEELNMNEFVWQGSKTKIKAFFIGMSLVGSGINIEFVAKDPYWDYLKEEAIIFNNTTDCISIHNIGDCPSYPYIKLFGSGDISVKSKEKAFTIKNVWNYVSIDMKERCASRDNSNKSFDFQGEHLDLECGPNTFDIKGDWTSIHVLCRPRWAKCPKTGV